jgi:hypothetical protein
MMAEHFRHYCRTVQSLVLKGLDRSEKPSWVTPTYTNKNMSYMYVEYTPVLLNKKKKKIWCML